MNSSRAAGMNGTYIETLILGRPSNPSLLIDDPENKTEIKSCRAYHNATGIRYGVKRSGQFKVHREQHTHLLKIEGYYLFVVQDEDIGKIIFAKKIRASIIEEKFRILEKPVTKHHYYSINWKKVMKLPGKTVEVPALAS